MSRRLCEPAGQNVHWTSAARQSSTYMQVRSIFPVMRPGVLTVSNVITHGVSAQWLWLLALAHSHDCEAHVRSAGVNKSRSYMRELRA